MDLANEMRALTVLVQLQENEVMSRALREMSIRNRPWYKRPYYRFMAWKGFRKAWRQRMAQNYKRVAEIKNREKAEEIMRDVISNNPNAN